MAEFKVPELGESVAGGDVTRVLVKVGDVVAREQSVLELETDKATIEVPTAVGGVVAEVKVKVGDKIKVGHVLLVLRDGPPRKEQEAAPAEADRASLPREKVSLAQDSSLSRRAPWGESRLRMAMPPGRR